MGQIAQATVSHKFSRFKGSEALRATINENIQLLRDYIEREPVLAARSARRYGYRSSFVYG
jgi:hypothetical protein